MIRKHNWKYVYLYNTTGPSNNINVANNETNEGIKYIFLFNAYQPKNKIMIHKTIPELNNIDTTGII